MSVTGLRLVDRRSVVALVEQTHGDGDRARPLVRALEDVVDEMHAAGPTWHLRAELTALLDAWAVALVQLHRRPVTAQTPPAPLPWVLTDPLPAWLDELPAAAGPAWAVRAHPGTARALAAARSGWRPVQSTHGDATGDAVRVSRSSGRLRAVLQPEPGGPGTGHVGDPRWDVATALDWLAIALSPAVDESWHVDAAEMFVRCYQLAGGDAAPTRLMATARTVQTAVEWTAQLAVLRDPSDEDLDWLSTLWSRPLALLGSSRAGGATTGG